MDPRPLIAVVDDDESVRESLPDLLREFGFEAHTFSSAEEFLSCETAQRGRRPRCQIIPGRIRSIGPDGCF
jgi:FixJ family two-component response regulator